MLTKTQFDTLLIPIIYHHFVVGMNRVPSMRSRLFLRVSTRLRSNRPVLEVTQKQLNFSLTRSVDLTSIFVPLDQRSIMKFWASRFR